LVEPGGAGRLEVTLTKAPPVGRPGVYSRLIRVGSVRLPPDRPRPGWNRHTVWHRCIHRPYPAFHWSGFSVRRGGPTAVGGEHCAPEAPVRSAIVRSIRSTPWLRILRVALQIATRAILPLGWASRFSDSDDLVSRSTIGTKSARQVHVRGV
jgi:hypothetical protein